VLWVYFASSLVATVALFAVHWTLKGRLTKMSHIDPGRLQDTLAVILIAAYTARWYCISVCFTIFNKWFLNEYHGGFEFPIIYTSIHMCMQFLISRIWACVDQGASVEPISWWQYLTVAAPIGVSTALDVMLSNFSLLYISLTLYTIIKGTVLIWVFLWGVLFNIEIFRLSTFCAVLGIVGGIGLAVATSTDVSLVGVIMVLCAAAAGGVRWALVQKLMAVDDHSRNVFVSIHRFSPASALAITPVALVTEVVPFFQSTFYSSSSSAGLAATATLIAVGGGIAFLLITTEVHLVNLTSSLTMGVLGQVKELIQILLSMIVFRDHMNVLNATGIAIAMISVGIYKRIKYAEKENSSTIAYCTLSQVELELKAFDDALDDSLSDVVTDGCFDFDDDIRL